jgi:glycosyltransferase involved in cell wall biosynthesis
VTEIIFLDGGSLDNTLKIIDECLPILHSLGIRTKVCRNLKPIGTARKVGMELSTNKIVLQTNVDLAYVDSDYIDEAVNELTKCERTAVCLGPQLLILKNRVLEIFENFSRYFFYKTLSKLRLIDNNLYKRLITASMGMTLIDRIKTKKVKFRDLEGSEDVIFVREVLAHDYDVKIILRPFYVYEELSFIGIIKKRMTQKRIFRNSRVLTENASVLKMSRVNLKDAIRFLMLMLTEMVSSNIRNFPIAFTSIFYFTSYNLLSILYSLKHTT